jgi:hypothetical protein
MQVNRYRVEYIDENGMGNIEYVEGVGIFEAMDVFLDTYCPVQTIVSVHKHSAATNAVLPREQQTVSVREDNGE